MREKYQRKNYYQLVFSIFTNSWTFSEKYKKITKKQKYQKNVTAKMECYSKIHDGFTKSQTSLNPNST